MEQKIEGREGGRKKGMWNKGTRKEYVKPPDTIKDPKHHPNQAESIYVHKIRSMVK